MDFLGISAINPALLFGGLAVASPIIIHLLSKRKFKILEWAAMDFLLEAERRNRRRVRLEQLILLLLRCLAMLLIALMVSRPFVKPTGFAAGLAQAVRFERVVLLDDSPSMAAQVGRTTAFEQAKESLIALVRGSIRDRTGDTLTVLTTSRPERPVLSGQYITKDKVDGLVRRIQQIPVSDFSARYDQSLLGVERLLRSRDGNQNRVVYVFTDLRKQDWASVTGTSDKHGLMAAIRRTRKSADGMYVVDAGTPLGANLTVSAISIQEKSLVAGVPARFEVTVKNHGEEDASDVDVSFAVGTAAPERDTIDLVKAGGKASVPFTFTFQEQGSAEVVAEIQADELPADNKRFLAARVNTGIRMLVVDGEPSSEFGEAETFFLERALAPPGEVLSGNAVRIVTENQFESLDFEPFQVIFLCNLYRLSEQRSKALEKWVRGGGGLIFFLGDQVDDVGYNELLHLEGKGLFPLQLIEVAGDESERKWAGMTLKAPNHPVLKVFQGVQNPFLERVKVFRWWRGTAPVEEISAGRSRILASLTDTEESPLVVERFVGDGRVLVMATTTDVEWNTWPSDPSYVVSVLEMARYMARATTGRGTLSVGVPLRHVLDPVLHQTEARISTPKDPEGVSLQAIPSEDGSEIVLSYDEVERSGFYRLGLQRRDGGEDVVLFGSNIDPREGNLKRINADSFRSRVSEVGVEVVRGEEILSRGDDGSRTEFWRRVLLALVLVLCAEQLLAWWFGTKR